MIWFKNLQAYRLLQPVPVFSDVQTLNKALHARPSREPGSNDLCTYGFTPPYAPREWTLADRETPELLDELEPPTPCYARAVNNGEFLLLAAKRIDRKIPGQAVKRALAKKIADIEYQQQRKVYKKERDQLKDEIVQSMLPHAFPTDKVTYALIDTRAGMILVNESSQRKAEDLLSTLRECLGSLPVRPIRSKLPPSTTFTRWVRNGVCSTGFHLLDAAIMEDIDDAGGKVAMARQDLTSEEAQLHVQSGKQVTKLLLAYEDKLGFLADSHLQISRVFFPDLVKDQAEQDGGDDAYGQWDATVLMMGRTFREALPALLTALGGEDLPEGA